MNTRANNGWVVEQGPVPRSVRMPRATGQVEPAANVFVVNTFHSQVPVQVASGATTIDMDLTIKASLPAHVVLEVFAGAAFDAFSAATEALERVRSNVALEKQLNSLSVDFFEDFGKALDQASIAGLRHFLLAHQNVLPPIAISADSTGRIEATWEAMRGQSASLKFLDDEKFHYALVVETPEGRKRPWGTAGRFEVFVARPEARTILGEGAASPVPSS